MADTDDDIDETEEKSKGDAEADADLLEEAKKQFRESEEAESDNRKRGEESLRFGRMGEQWEEAARKAREGRPTLTVNMMPAYVHQVVNDARQNKPEIKVHPVDGSGDKATAEVFNGLIRAIEVNSDSEVAYDTAIDNAASAGFGYIRVDLEYAHEDAFDLDIKINRIANPFSVYGDPTSIAGDSSDWRRAFVVETLSESEFKSRYPKAKETIDWEGRDQGSEGWKGESGIRIAEWWKRDEEEKKIALLSNGAVVALDEFLKPIVVNGVSTTQREIMASQNILIVRDRAAKFWKVEQRIITGAEILEKTDWIGRYIPIIPVYGEEVWHEGKRNLFSLIHWGMDPQRIYNYGRSASIETAALQPKAPYIGLVGQFQTDAAKWASANRENHPYIEADLVEGAPSVIPQRQSPPQPSGAWLQEAKIATDDIKSTIGMFNASMGQRSNEVSGKAINSRKLEGDVSTFHFIDNLSRGIRQVGRVLVDLIPKVYDRPRMVRILGEDRREAHMVSITGKAAGPVPSPAASPAQAAAPQAPAEVPAPPTGAPVTPPMPGMVAAPQQAPPDKFAGVFDLGAGKYDVTVTAGPSYGTRREEAANHQMEMIRAFPQLGMIAGDIVARNLDFPGADEFGDRIKQAREAAATAPQGKPAEMDPLVKAKMDAEAKVQSAEIGAKADVQVAQINAEAKKARDLLEVQADKDVALARVESEKAVAMQRSIITAASGTDQQPVQPGGNIG